MSLLLMMGSSAFGPASVPGLAIWLDAATSITKDGSDIVTTWGDRSGNANDFTTGTSIRKPKYIANAINGYPAIQGRYDGTNASNLAAADATSMNCTSLFVMAVVSRLTDMGANEQIGGKYVTALNQREHRILINSTDNLNGSISLDGSALTTPFLGSATPTATPMIVALSFTPGTSNIILNSGTVGTSAAPASIFNGTGTYQIFSREGGLEPFAGYIAEYLFYNQIPSAANQTLLWRYYGTKYGITLT